MVGRDRNESAQMRPSDIVDLRTALDFLAQYPGEFISTKVEVDPYLELAGVYRRIDDAMPGFLQNVYLHPAGGGKWLAILQVKKRSPIDEGRQRQAAIQAFAAFFELKQVILVDEDVDLFDSNDVLWALTCRYQGDIDSIFLPGVLCHPIDPTSRPEYNPMIRQVGNACKTIFDCTVPFDMKERFERAQFIDVDVEKFLA